MEEMHVEFVVEESMVSDVRPAVEAEGGEVLGEDPAPAGTTDRFTGMEPLIVLSVALAAGSFIRVLSNVVLDHTRSGGVVIDTRVTPVKMQRDPSLDRGTVLIVNETETLTFFPDEEDEALRVLQETLGGRVNLP